jgi:hypothetical protein
MPRRAEILGHEPTEDLPQRTVEEPGHGERHARGDEEGDEQQGEEH